MKQFLTYFLSVLFLNFAFYADAEISSSNFQNTTSIQSPTFVSNNDPFGGRAFIENKGQFKNINGQKVLYAIQNGYEKIYFTNKGLIYELTKVYPITERQHEALEKGKTNAIRPNDVNFVNMNWLGSKEEISLEASEKQSYYITYGDKEFNSYAYKKILYKNVYENIDIEYTIPEDKESGIKYSFILHPGANASDINIAYTGDVDKIKIKDKEIIIKTPIDDIVEHSPISFYEDKVGVASEFNLQENIISFSFPNSFDSNKTVVIDPWVSSTSTLASNTCAFDVDYDFIGNTYVYGGNAAFKVASYNNVGTLAWVFSGIIITPAWNSAPYNYASNFGVDRFNSKTYIGQGFNGSGNVIIRLNASGNYDNFINSPNSQFQEVWDMGFHCTTAEMFVLGGGTTSNISAVTMNSVTASLTLTTFQPLITSAAQDVVSHAIDDNANIFVIYAGNGGVNNKISLVNSAFNNNIWTQPSGYTAFSEIGNKSAYVSTGVSSNGYNALAVNANYLFYYNGFNIVAYNKTNGTITASTSISGLTAKAQGGIAVDDCNNLYLGGNGSILTFSFTGSAFVQTTSIPLNISTTYQYVYDLKLDKQTKLLYACGSGFVGVYSPINTLACLTQSSACLFSQGGINVTTTSITCASLGSATCTAIGGVGPHTYTWLPSLQSGSVATGLSPGLHSIIVHDIGTNTTYTATTFLNPLVALTGTVPNPLYLSCYGSASGTAAVIGLSGGSGNQSYLWANGSSTQTTAIASGLGIGVYSITVIDALTSCAINQTFAVVQPPALTLNVVASSPSTCANSSVMLTPLIGGGTPNYTYSWTAGPSTGTYLATQTIPGIHVYTLTAFDVNSCPITFTIPINYISTPTLVLNNISTCLGHPATLTVSGANTYTWNTNSTGSTLSDNPLTSTLYSVVGSGSICTASVSAWINVLGLPTPTLSSNSPVCSGQVLNLNALGGATYAWSGPAGFNSNVQSPVINSSQLVNTGTYTVLVTGANSCTALAAHSVQILPLPPLSAGGSTVCVTQTITMFANSSSTNNFAWVGPNGFVSTSQYPSITNPSVMNSGFYNVFVTDLSGCTNSAAVHVTVTAMPNPTFSTNSPLCYDKTLIFNSAGTTGALTYNWFGPNGFTSNLNTPQISNVSLLSSGVYTLTVGAGPCVTSVSNSVLVYPLPNISIIGSPKVCETKSLTLGMSASFNVQSFKWYGPLGYFQPYQSITRFPSDSSFSGTYTALVTDINNCSNSQTVEVMVNSNPVLVLPNVMVCFNEPATLIAGGADFYTWSGPNFFQGIGSSVVVKHANSVSPLTYTVVGTYSNGCLSEATLNLNTRALPQPSLTAKPGLTLCFNDEGEFEGYGAKSYVWNGPGGMMYEGKTLHFKASSLFSSGAYTLTAIDEFNCRASIDTNLLVYNLPNGSLSKKNTESCVPFCSDFVFNSNNNIPLKTNWTLNQKQFSTYSFSYCFKTSGNYVIEGIIFDTLTTCSNTVNFMVEAHPKPLADFSVLPQVVVENNEVTFMNESTGEELTNFNWYFISNKGFTSSLKNVSYRFENEGNYPVVLLVKNKWGCVDSTIKAIHVDPDFLIYIPNAFTPNEDNLNDVFKPVIRADKLYHLFVFDRWGALIFESTDSKDGWDGTYRGKPCKSDTYTWRIDISSIGGEQKLMNGHVTLYR